MLSFLSANIGTIVVLAMLVGMVTAIIKKLIRDKQKGACSGCSGCSGCAGACHENQD